MDEHEKDEDYRCTWSAEDQKLLAENSANKAAIEKVRFKYVVYSINFISLLGDCRQIRLAVAQTR